MSAPFPACRFRSDAEKIEIFSQLHALGYRREPGNLSLQNELAILQHRKDSCFIYAFYDKFSQRHVIWFTNDTTGHKLTLVNSGAHMISYLKKYKLYPNAT